MKQKNKISKLIVIFIIINITSMLMMSWTITVQALVGKKSGFTIPTLSGNQGEDVAAIATANIGKKSADFGYSSAWCAYFATDCASLAGVSSSVVPSNGSTTLFYEDMIKNRKATKIVIHNWNSSTVTVNSNPQPGDFLLIRWDKKGYTDGKGVNSKGQKIEEYTMDHTALVVSYNPSTKVVTYVGGNQGTGTNTTNPVSKESLSVTDLRIARIIRPAYTTVPTTKYETMSSGDILLKNKSTNTYMTVDGGTASNGQNVSVASKTSSNAFKFSLSGGVTNYILSKINKSYVVNPYSDNPGNNTNITLYTKDSSGTQTWKFEAVSGGYIIHNGFNESCVLTVEGTNVKLATKTGKDNQIWILESPVPSLSSITVENAGKTDYYVGETLDTGGMKITAKYEDGSTKDITASAKVLYDFSTPGTKNVTFSYTEENVTKTTQLAVTVKEIPTGFFSGSGTQSDPFLIQNKADIEKMRDLVNNTEFNPVYGRAYYLQTADIDLENENWIPIGLGFGEDGQYNYKTRMFYGVYNGSNHYIRNLHVDGAYENAGLFGAIRENTCEVRNIVVTGQVKTSGMNAGGIAGQQQYSALIENCAFIGDVSANEMAGGIVGYLYNGTSRENSFCVSNCYHIGSVNSNKYAGGLVGRILFNQYGGNEFYVLIENSYHAKGKVSGGTTAGAICSEIVRNDNVTCKANIVNCFAGTDCAVNIGVKDATVDTSMLKSNSDMRKLAADMGEPFADHNDSQLCDGYTVFAWQIDRSIGDINADGEVNVADVILLQKWILAIPDTHLANWKAADLYEDNQLNVFDLCLLKRKLLEK